MSKTTPKDFFLWAGAMVSLYWSIVAFIFLIFEYINYTFPNPLASYPSDPYQSSIPYYMASIIVLFPIYLTLAWLIRRDINKDATRADIWVRRWAIIFTLFVAGVTVAVDLIILLTTFLSGDAVTGAFILKVLLVLLVAAGVFMHFIADFWGYWSNFPSRRNSVFISVAVLAFSSVIAGFFILGTPQQARLYRFDDQKVQDLQNLQYQIVSYYQQKQNLPTNLEDLNDSLSNGQQPTDSQNGKSYVFQATGPLSFKLCADFNKASRAGMYTNRGEYSRMPTPAYIGSAGIKGQDNWQHTAGAVCFDRTIDPQRYPPTTPQMKGI